MIEAIKETLESLFVVNRDAPDKEAMNDASRGYGLLLHASGLKHNSSRRNSTVAIVTEKVL